MRIFSDGCVSLPDYVTLNPTRTLRNPGAPHGAGWMGEVLPRSGSIHGTRGIITVRATEALSPSCSKQEGVSKFSPYRLDVDHRCQFVLGRDLPQPNWKTPVCWHLPG